MLTGRKLTLFILSSFLNIGATSASFSASGNILDVIDKFIRFVNGSHSTGELNLNKRGVILSQPVDFLTLTFERSLDTWSQVTAEKLKQVSQFFSLIDNMLEWFSNCETIS